MIPPGESLLPAEERPTPAEVQEAIEDLSDSEVQEFYWNTARAFVRRRVIMPNLYNTDMTSD